jgi:hypothetical protein
MPPARGNLSREPSGNKPGAAWITHKNVGERLSNAARVGASGRVDSHNTGRVGIIQLANGGIDPASLLPFSCAGEGHHVAAGHRRLGEQGLP